MSGGVFWGVCGLSMTLGSLSADGCVCVPVLLFVWHGAFSTRACRQLGGARSWSWNEDLWESSHCLISLGTRNCLVFQCPGLGTPTPETQTQALAWETIPHMPNGLVIKGGKKKKAQEENKWKQTDKKPTVNSKDKSNQTGTSLLVQWLRIWLPMQGTWVRSLVWEDPTCHGATKPMCHNHWACPLEPVSHNYWTCSPQLLKPTCLETVFCNKRSHCNKKPVHHNKEYPSLAATRQSPSKTQCSQKF